ncbi:hypothetical protein F5148DRAFT_1277618 [Russula earlei]|uniref:Uncharacterized protein n=1 Tax=Russula earlei TaxID=71964 RepID=A0ACC0TXS8_9AGAM|nr:hypothetical protein F5148DRAFT_1277618 [Russula earlei]
MSATSTPNDSPVSVHIQPLHNPQNAAHVSIPQAPLSNATNGPTNHRPGMGARAFLAKRMAKSQNPTYVSPTDNLMTPVTQKISAARKKRFNKGMPVPAPALFGDTTANASDDDEDVIPPASSGTSGELATTDDNPF